MQKIYSNLRQFPKFKLINENVKVVAAHRTATLSTTCDGLNDSHFSGTFHSTFDKIFGSF